MQDDQDADLRRRVRHSLESILVPGETGEASPDVGRLQAILEEETEEYYKRQGMVKHMSRTGRAYWVTAEEAERLSKRGRRRQHHHSSWLSQNMSSAAIWVGTALVAALLVAYLFATEVI